jgi:hypothetical protein
VGLVGEFALSTLVISIEPGPSFEDSDRDARAEGAAAPSDLLRSRNDESLKQGAIENNYKMQVL